MFFQRIVWNFTFSKFQTTKITNLFPFQMIFSRYIRHFFCAKFFNSKAFEIFFFPLYSPCPCTFSVKIARNSRKYYGYFALAQYRFLKWKGLFHEGIIGRPNCMGNFSEPGRSNGTVSARLVNWKYRKGVRSCPLLTHEKMCEWFLIDFLIICKRQIFVQFQFSLKKKIISGLL